MNVPRTADLALSVVIPAFQEAQRLPRSLAEIEAFLTADGRSYEVIVVDDGSTDETAAATDQLDQRFRTVVLDRNRGKGAAVRQGVAETQGKLVLVTDADLSSPIDQLPRLERALLGAPLAFGSRALQRDLIRRRQPLYRESMGRVFSLLLRLLGVRGIRDTQCGFKLIEGEVARALFSDMIIDGFAFDVELLLRAQRQGLEVAEVPVVWNHVPQSRVHPVFHSAQMLYDVLRVRARLR